VTGINLPRIYNPVKQGQDQDPDGIFVRRWVPELAAVPDKFLQAPWTWDGFAGAIGDRYPARIVDHIQAAREARSAVWGVRRGADYRQAADAIQDKHGSRKSGVPNRGRRRPVKAKPAQLPLQFDG